MRGTVRSRLEWAAAILLNGRDQVLCQVFAAWNKQVYYAVKHLLIGAVMAAFLATAFA